MADSKLTVALRLLTEFNTEFEQRIDKSRESNELEALVHAMAELDNTCDSIAEVKTVTQKLYDRVRMSHIPDVMTNRGVDNIKVTGVGLCYLTDDMQVTQKDKDAVRTWLIEHHFENLITESVNAQTLAAFIKRRLKAREDIPFDLLTLRPITRAAIKTSGSKPSNEE